jgi:ATP adenylyltransferase
MVEQLWAPWRLSYVTGESAPNDDGCVLCAKHEQEDARAALVLGRGRHSYVILNLYPYNNGHSMVVPYRHVANLEDLTPEESAESLQLVQLVIRAMRESMNPGGFNVGLNLGSAAGAGIAPHLHWHIVPRWDGDTNFMPVLADIKVMPQHLEHTYDILKSALETHIQKAGI